MILKTAEKILVIASITAAFSASCVNNNELDLYGIPDCDTTNVTWDSKISAIMQANCVTCHGEEVSYNGVRHDSYESEMVVVNDGRLRGVVNHLDGYVKMPKDRGKLPACELQLINTWLDNGAPEN
ncbi:MAG: hypothetical protein A2X05_04755 [Bacteroidetes bacterium GWE2_41_25]|nr:MAG: hypothetical protein A2X03_11305 [Bacteroidetes bacterium GWA2_40_15]OFX84052.1 MAG: hypothetical protein A2X06_14410 [Bacteroidetes bacterium GWC2_40_22]OFX94214.1 MAG: hypothetical protein A2X05_04755 [Bacteroidetes bacterium GWE2_41_25]OFY59020.1 MAG: hypothetical protein A2X04_08300 [Bacteroidetes bacterium GWF2_41_9]HAM11239.1 hypothetical protein [Bacteroidales bacterium]